MNFCCNKTVGNRFDCETAVWYTKTSRNSVMICFAFFPIESLVEQVQTEKSAKVASSHQSEFLNLNLLYRSDKKHLKTVSEEASETWRVDWLLSTYCASREYLTCFLRHQNRKCNCRHAFKRQLQIISFRQHRTNCNLTKFQSEACTCEMVYHLQRSSLVSKWDIVAFNKLFLFKSLYMTQRYQQKEFLHRRDQ